MVPILDRRRRRARGDNRSTRSPRIPRTPEDGVSEVLRSESRVDFPAPLGPTMATRSPRPISMVSGRTATNSPYARPTPRRSTAGTASRRSRMPVSVSPSAFDATRSGSRWAREGIVVSYSWKSMPATASRPEPAGGAPEVSGARIRNGCSAQTWCTGSRRPSERSGRRP